VDVRPAVVVVPASATDCYAQYLADERASQGTGA
jgi:hypothetical protein